MNTVFHRLFLITVTWTYLAFSTHHTVFQGRDVARNSANMITINETSSLDRDKGTSEIRCAPVACLVG